MHPNAVRRLAYNHRLTACINNVRVQHFDVPAVHERVCRLLDP
jgi:hypothetical protein